MSRPHQIQLGLPAIAVSLLVISAGCERRPPNIQGASAKSLQEKQEVRRRALAADDAKHRYEPTAKDPSAAQALNAARAFVVAYGYEGDASRFSKPIPRLESHGPVWLVVFRATDHRLDQIAFWYDMDAKRISYAFTATGSLYDLRGYQGELRQPRLTLPDARQIARRVFALRSWPRGAKVQEDVGLLGGGRSDRPVNRKYAYSLQDRHKRTLAMISIALVDGTLLFYSDMPSAKN